MHTVYNTRTQRSIYLKCIYVRVRETECVIFVCFSARRQQLWVKKLVIYMRAQTMYNTNIVEFTSHRTHFIYVCVRLVCEARLNGIMYIITHIIVIRDDRSSWEKYQSARACLKYNNNK